MLQATIDYQPPAAPPFDPDTLETGTIFQFVYRSSGTVVTLIKQDHLAMVVKYDGKLLGTDHDPSHQRPGHVWRSSCGTIPMSRANAGHYRPFAGTVTLTQ